VTAQALTLLEPGDRCLAALDDTGRAIARRVALRLVGFGDAAPAGRQQPVAVVAAGSDAAAVAEVLRRLADAGLVAIEGDAADPHARVQLVSGAIDGSPILQDWIRAHGDAERARRQLETDAARWRNGTGDGELLDRAQLAELAWLTAESRRDLGVSEAADAFVAASRVAARRRWWPGQSVVGSALAILLMLMILATPIILLFVVVLTAFVIHRFGLFG
jgi:hypothetical protein